MNKHVKMTVYIVLAALVLWGLGAAAKDAQKKFRGEIIYIGDSSMEMKKGKNDVKLTFSDATRFVDKDGKPAGKAIIEICQIAEAWYTTENRQNLLIKIQVIKESFCKK